MNEKLPAALAIALLAAASAWAPRGWSQAGSSLPPQLQTDAQREAARAARTAPGKAGGRVQPSNAAVRDAGAALGDAVLADVADAAAASAHNAAMRPPRGPDPVADRRGGVDPGPDPGLDDPLAPRPDGGPR